MEYRKLGKTDLDVSVICLGTMTWGVQNTEADAHQQLDYALDHGVNFIDTAEFYPVPPSAEIQGRTEQYIGTWFKARGNRDKVILATKVTGRSTASSYIRGGREVRLNREQMTEALDKSLQRLQTDYVDLYQLHWPDRSVNVFGQRGYVHQPDQDTIPLLETLTVLGDFVKAGKIRHVGLSNETPWGLMNYLRLADEHSLPRVVSNQNVYHLLNRTYEIGMAECSVREQSGLLAWSPLMGGVLSGKYLDGQKPESARMTVFERWNRYNAPHIQEAIRRYVTLARNHDLDPAQMALAFVNSRPFTTSTIIGATKMDQLQANIESINITLPQSVLDGIEAVQRDIPDPCV